MTKVFLLLFCSQKRRLFAFPLRREIHAGDEAFAAGAVGEGDIAAVGADGVAGA
jgi:hypothetical protein